MIWPRRKANALSGSSEQSPQLSRSVLRDPRTASPAAHEQGDATTRRWPVKFFIALAGVLVLGIVIGRIAAPGGTTAPPPIVRYGPATLSPGQDAMVAVSGDLVARAVREALTTTNLPFALDQVETAYTEEGLTLAARAGVEVFGVPLRGRFSSRVIPHARPDGTVGVTLVDTRAIGFSLPGSAVGLIEDAVNGELQEATAVPGYQVADVELTEEALLVYLRVDDSVIGEFSSGGR